ncbi:hypothetical protein J6590_009595 [Homalodisca vitripennis]|nr:hypothetical protein J6590_009595 [Homalodisca vitripennis]
MPGTPWIKLFSWRVMASYDLHTLPPRPQSIELICVEVKGNQIKCRQHWRSGVPHRSSILHVEQPITEQRGSGVGHRGARGREALSRLPGLAERRRRAHKQPLFTDTTF